jgi:hypothetical protein
MVAMSGKDLTFLLMKSLRPEPFFLSIHGFILMYVDNFFKKNLIGSEFFFFQFDMHVFVNKCK